MLENVPRPPLPASLARTGFTRQHSSWIRSPVASDYWNNYLWLADTAFGDLSPLGPAAP